MQLEPAEWRHTLAGCKVIIHQHLDTTLTLTIAGHRVGQYSAEGKLLTPLTKKQIRAAERTFKIMRDDRIRTADAMYQVSFAPDDRRYGRLRSLSRVSASLR